MPEPTLADETLHVERPFSAQAPPHRWVQASRLPGDIVLREEVANHYSAKGYTVHERAKVRGSSGAIHVVDMVAQGPLGNLVIAIEDAGGFEGPEMHAIRRAAKDIGATPVMAAHRVPEGLRRRAAEAGVVLLDDAMLARTAPAEPKLDAAAIEYPPWPGAETVQEDRPEVIQDFAPRRAAKSTDPGFWRYPRDGGVATAAPATTRPATTAPATAVTLEDLPEIEEKPTKAAFEWLPKEQVAVAPLRRANVPAPPPRNDALRWAVGAILFGASAGGVLYALSRILG